MHFMGWILFWTPDANGCLTIGCVIVKSMGPSCVKDLFIEID